MKSSYASSDFNMWYSVNYKVVVSETNFEERD